MKKLFALMIGLFICLSLANIGDASTTGGSGYFRWVNLEYARTNCTISANVSIPETIYNDSNTDLAVKFKVVNNGTIEAANYTLNYTVFVTIGSVTRNVSKLLNLTKNATVNTKITFARGDVLSGGNVEGNNSVTITLKEETTQKDTWSGYIDVKAHGYGFGVIMMMMPLLLMIMVFGVIIKIIQKSMKK